MWRPWKRDDNDEQAERAIVLHDWPQPAVVAEPKVTANEIQLSLIYRTESDRFAAVNFPLCMYFALGAPNDEALGGHPLARAGLKHYSVHEVLNSSLIRELERRNSVHPRHNRATFLENLKHYVFTFQDSTLDCVVEGGPSWPPGVSVVHTAEEALRELSNH
jgi:hypothetical protein